MTVPRIEGITIDPNSTMPLSSMLKRLRMKMASLQSARTQCCCCAVGVFAAMFGIFILSAGICIVLNVTFMEVDTSGLPPNLHNENGKKVVGIILICVAIACLGISATVSILYFTMCSRKTQESTKATANGHQKHHKHNAMGITSGHERTRSRGASSGMKRMAPSYLEGVQIPRQVTQLRPEYSKSKPHRVHKSGLPRSVLPPHQEEDLEATKSTMELNVANQICSPRRSSRGIHLTQTEREEEQTSFASASVPTIPKIKTSMFVEEEDFSGTRNDYMETHLIDTLSMCEEDSVSRTCSELYEDTTSVGQISPFNTIESGTIVKSYLKAHHFDILKEKPLDEQVLQTPPELLHNIDVWTEISITASAPVSSSQPSLPDRQLNFLVVKPAIGVDFSTQSSSSSSDTVTNQSSSLSSDTVTNHEKYDHVLDLPLTFSHQKSHVFPQITNEQDSRSESRSSFNSAFSFDGDDPANKDMEILQKKMDKLLESDSSDN